MNKLHIITPVKDSPVTTLRTIEGVMGSEIRIDFSYYVYNDFSAGETTLMLDQKSAEMGFKHIKLADITSHPSPNYLLVLQLAQQKAFDEDAHLIIVESDVIVKNNTLQAMVDYTSILEKSGMIAAVTVDEAGKINFPYLYASKMNEAAHKTRKRLSFCCTLITNDMLRSFDFKLLDSSKSWYDVFISHKSLKLGFNNYLLTNLPILHLPHSSRPWKQLKYSNPLKYYWRKFLNNKDKI